MWSTKIGRRAADDELLVSTMHGRAKAKAVALDGKVSISVLDEHWPFAHLLAAFR